MNPTESPKAKRARYRAVLQESYPEIAALLREEFRVPCARWADGPRCTTHAVVNLAWSDREGAACAEHIPDAIVSIALDHSYDRYGIRPEVTAIWPHWLAVEAGAPEQEPTSVWADRVERVCVAARAYFDEVRPGWRDESVDLTDDERAEMLRRCREALTATEA